MAQVPKTARAKALRHGRSRNASPSWASTPPPWRRSPSARARPSATCTSTSPASSSCSTPPCRQSWSQELTPRTRARIRALGAAKDVRELAERAEYHALAGELLDYCLAHRAAVVIVLTRAEGTPFAGFRERFRGEPGELGARVRARRLPRADAEPELRFVLRACLPTASLSAVAARCSVFPTKRQRAPRHCSAHHPPPGRLETPVRKPRRTSMLSRTSSGKSPVVTTAAGARARERRSCHSRFRPCRPGAGQADRPRRARRRR